MLTTVASRSTRCENAKSDSSAPPMETKAPMIGMPAAMKPAEDEEHDDEGQGQCDALAADQVALDRGRDGRDDLVGAADGALRLHRCGDLEERLLGGCLGLVLRRPVEARLEVDHGHEASRGGRAALQERGGRRVGEPSGSQQRRADRGDAGHLRDLLRGGGPVGDHLGVGEVGAGHLHRQRLERGLGLLDDLARLRRLGVDGRGARGEPVEERLPGHTSDGDREAG